MFVLLSRDSLGDCVMPHAEVHAGAQASRGNISILSHLNVISPEHFHFWICAKQ